MPTPITYIDVQNLLQNYILYKELPSSISNEEVTAVIQLLLDYIQQDVNNTGGSNYNPNVPNGTMTSKDIGELPQGTLVDVLRGISFSQLFDRILFQTNPVFIAPSTVLSMLPTDTLFEIGQSVNFSGQQAFSRGQIFQPWNNTQQDFRSGVAVTYSIMFPTSGGVYIDQVSTSFTYLYTIPMGKRVFRGKVTYIQGPQPRDVNGIDYPSRLPAGSVLSNQITIEGVYPLFASSITVGSMTKQDLISMIDSNSMEITLASESIGSAKQAFQISQVFGGKSITNIQYYNTVSQSYDSTNRLADFTRTSITNTIQGNSISYYNYLYNGIMRGLIKLKLTFA